MALLELDRVTPGELPSPWQIWRGSDWRKRLLILDPADDTPAVSPTWTFEARLWQDYEPVSNIAIATSYINGGLELSIDKVNTAELSARSYDIELWATDLAGTTGKLILGKAVAQGRR